MLPITDAHRLRRIRLSLLFVCVIAALALVLLFGSNRAGKKEYPKAKDTYPFLLKVTDYYGAKGYGFDYYVDKQSIVVVYWDDFGSDSKEVLNKSMTEKETQDWASYWSEFPIEELKQDYTNPSIADGLQMDFIFIVGDKEKTVNVKNVKVEKLEELAEKINSMLPDRLKMGRGDDYVVFPKKIKGNSVTDYSNNCLVLPTKLTAER